MKMNFCAGCQDRIEDPFLLNVNERTWHVRCVRCVDCGEQLSEKCFYRDAKIYCREDFYKRFGPKCTGCSFGISPTDYVRKTKDLVYHLSCFVCLICGKKLSTGDHCYNLDGGKFVCKDDYISSRNLNPASGSPSEAEIDENLFSPCESDHLIEQHSEDDHLLSNAGTTLHSHHNHLSSNHQPHLQSHHHQLPPSHLQSHPHHHSPLHQLAPGQCMANGHTLSNSMNSSNPLNSLSQLSINNNSANNSLNSSSSNLCPPIHLNLNSSNGQPPNLNPMNNSTNAMLTNGQLNSNAMTSAFPPTGLMIPNQQTTILANGTPNGLQPQSLTGGPNNLAQLTINCSQGQLPPNLADKSSPMSANSDGLSELNGSDMLSGSPSSNPGKRRGPRTTIKAKQLETLRAAFTNTPKPTRHVREALAQETGLNMRVIQFKCRRELESKERRLNQRDLNSNRRPFYRGNRNGRNQIRSLRHPIGDDEVSAQGTFSYFSESSNPGDYYNQTPVPNAAYYNDYNDYKNFNPQLPDAGSLSNTPILTSLNNGSTNDSLKESSTSPQHTGGGQQVSSNQLSNNTLQTSPQSQNSSTNSSLINLNGSTLQANTSSGQSVYNSNTSDIKPIVTAGDYLM